MCTNAALSTKIYLVDCLMSFDDAPIRLPSQDDEEIRECAQQILFGLSLLSDPASSFVTLLFGLITDDDQSLCSTCENNHLPFLISLRTGFSISRE